MTGTPPPHLLHVIPTFVAAGAQTRVVQLMSGFGARFRHTVLALDGRTDALALVAHGADARPLEPSGSAGVRGMRAVLRREAPDLLLTYNWGSFDAVLAARLFGFRAHVHHEDGFNADEATRQKRRRVLARRLGLRKAHRVVVPSHRLLDVARSSWRLPPEKVQLISNGVDTDRFAPDPGDTTVRDRLAIPRDALVVGAVGHLRPVKNFGRLFAACALLRNENANEDLGAREVHVLVLGDGPERAALEAAAARHPPPGGRVHFAGHQDDLVPYYRAMDVFALSSDSEQQPVSLLEAMATGVPVASTDVGDVRAVLPSEGARYLASLAQPEPEVALARAIASLLSDGEERAKLATLGRERAGREFSFAAMLAAYGELYAGALAGRG